MKIDDKHILNIFVNKNNKVISSRINKKNILKYPDEIIYLKNRFPNDDFISYTYVIQRIRDGIETLPTCRVCGKKLYNYKAKWCNNICQLKDKDFIEYRNSVIDKEQQLKRYKETCMERYGVTSGFGTPNNRCVVESKECRKLASESYKNTMHKKYNVDNYFQTEEFQDKIKDRKDEIIKKRVESYKITCNERYGVDSVLQLDKVRNNIDFNVSIDHARHTMMERYGVDNPFKMKHVREKVESPECRKKAIETKRKNGTFNTSKPEEESYELIKKVYPDVIRQYKCSRYPFACDFYIPSTDTFIECQYSWTHGYHPYNPDSKEDQDRLNELKSKYGDKWWHTWVDRDPNKRKIAKENNLNYIEFWNINELKAYIKCE